MSKLHFLETIPSSVVWMFLPTHAVLSLLRTNQNIHQLITRYKIDQPTTLYQIKSYQYRPFHSPIFTHVFKACAFVIINISESETGVHNLTAVWKNKAVDYNALLRLKTKKEHLQWLDIITSKRNDYTHFFYAITMATEDLDKRVKPVYCESLPDGNTICDESILMCYATKLQIDIDNENIRDNIISPSLCSTTWYLNAYVNTKIKSINHGVHFCEQNVLGHYYIYQYCSDLICIYLGSYRTVTYCPSCGKKAEME